MEESQSFAQNGSAAATRVILQLPPQSRRDGPSGQDVRGHKNHSSQNDPVQQNMKNVMAEQQQEQDSISITHPGTLELQVDHHNYPQYLPGYSQPPFSILGGLASPRCHLGPPGTRSSPLSSRPGRPIQQQMNINLPEINSSSFTSASYFNPPNSPRPMFHSKNSQVPIKLLARSYMNRQGILREGRHSGSTNGCSDIDEVHDSVGLSTSDSSTVTSSWNSEDYILPFFDTTSEPQFKPLSDVDSETALAGLALPVNELHKFPMTFDDCSLRFANQPSHESFQATHLAQNKYGESLLTEEEMGSWYQLSSPISSSAARNFSQASRAAIAIEQRKAKKIVEKAERLPCRNCGKFFLNIKRHLQQGHCENFLGDASHIREVLSHVEGVHSSPGTESQRQNLIFNEHTFPCNPEHAFWDRRPRSWSSVKLRAAQLSLDMMTDGQYKECAAKINALVDVRPIDLEVADCIIRDFHRSIQMRTDDDALLEMTAKERALMAEKRKEADISEKQATDATAHPPVKEIAVSADREGVPALVREEAYPTSAKSRSQSLVSPTSEYSNAMQLPLDLPHVSPTRNNTLSSFTEDDTDWGEDEITGSLQDLHFADFSAFSQESLFSQDQMNETLMRPVFSPMKEELIDRIMKEFWAIFDQESGTILGNPSPGTGSMDADENLNDNKQTASEGGEDSTQNTGSNSFSTTNNNSQKYPRSVLGRHSREGEDDDQDNGDGRSPKKPKTFVSPCQTQDGNTKFACPYRKRDPRKYCVQHWRSCALTPLDTVARVKAHLYKYHRIFPCQRCQKLFKDPDAVTLHAQTPEGCEVRHIEHTDGVTPKIAEKLRSKKKARDQTEAERWRDIYELLFPNEMTPSPYFETVQEDTALSPDSRQLADYDEYYRRELPRAVRAALEESIQNQSQPIEENLRNRFMDIVRDCQDLISTRYRSSGGRATATPSINPTSPDFPMISMRETRNDMSLTANGTAELSFGRITPPFFHPPSPQSHLRSRLEVSDLQNNASKAPDGKDPSDSGYSSNTSGLQSRHPSSFHNTIDSASLSTSQSHVASSESFSANAESTWNLDDGLFGMNPDNDVMNEDDTSAFNQSWADFKAQSAEGNAWNLYMSNSEVEDPFSSDQPL